MCRKLVLLVFSFVLVLSISSNAFAQMGKGHILYEWWFDIGGTAVADLTSDPDFPDNPDETEWRTSFEGPVNWKDNYGTRARGYVYPPASGDYNFWISGDDYCELYLSTDDDPANMDMIAEVPGWTQALEWVKYPEQKSNAITLVANRKYYIEALMKEAGGGDSLTVAWEGPVIGAGTNIIEGRYLSPVIRPVDMLPRDPNPADGAVIRTTWISMLWTPGANAASHDVYFGDNYADVKAGTGDTFVGNQTGGDFIVGFPGFPFPDGLVPGTTYYWRIKEINDGDPDSPWDGPVWSFSVAPRTAWSPDPADGAEDVDPNGARLSWEVGYNAKLHYVYFGDDYNTVNNAAGALPTGLLYYDPGVLELAKTYYWRVDEFDAMTTHKGDVWSFSTPGAVGSPLPTYGDSDVGLNAILSWTPADSAASHQLYFGMDKDAVLNAGTGSPEYIGSKALGAESYDPGMLEAQTTYYWRVDEVDGQGNTAKGPLWIFTTSNFLLVDDFESYTDDDAAGEAIWQTWIDGFGVADNGAQAGYFMPPYAEQTIVHGGVQSMPLVYTNDAGVTNSEVSMTLAAPRDWTQVNVAELSVWFRGAYGNAAETLYVAIANSAGSPAIVANDDANAAVTGSWTQWNIPLQAFADQGINLGNVDKIAVGLGTKGGAGGSGSGTLYVDDIRLYPSAP